MNRRTILRYAGALSVAGNAGCSSLSCFGNPDCPGVYRVLEISASPDGWSYPPSEGAGTGGTPTAVEKDPSGIRDTWPLQVEINHEFRNLHSEDRSVDELTFDDVTLAIYDQRRRHVSNTAVGEISERNGFQRNEESDDDGCCPSTRISLTKEAIPVTTDRFPYLIAARASVDDCGGDEKLSYVVFTAGGYYKRVLRDCDERIPFLDGRRSPTPNG